MGNDFGVGLGGELVPFLDQLLFQLVGRKRLLGPNNEIPDIRRRRLAGTGASVAVRIRKIADWFSRAQLRDGSISLQIFFEEAGFRFEELLVLRA